MNPLLIGGIIDTVGKVADSLFTSDEERARLQTEQQLHPLRDKLEQARLAEQQARLHFEFCVEQLAACAIDENGIYRATRRRGGSRFQQYAPSDPRLFRDGDGPDPE